MFSEFKEFIARGNIVDLAIAVVIGAAFGKIVTSFTEDLLMPVIGAIFGKVDFSNKFVSLSGGDYLTLKAAKDAGAAVLAYGNFITVLINFLIVAFALFLVVKAVNKMHKKTDEAPAEPSDEVKLLTDIRDALKAR